MSLARLIVFATLLAPSSVSAGDLLDSPAFPRHRPGLASAGPRGLPDSPRQDPPSQSAAKYPVEPAAFQSSGAVKPLVGRQALWPEDPLAESTSSPNAPGVTQSGAARGAAPEYGGPAESTFVFRSGGVSSDIERVTGFEKRSFEKGSASASPATAPPPALAAPAPTVSVPPAVELHQPPVASEPLAAPGAKPTNPSDSPSGAPQRSLALPPPATSAEPTNAFHPDNPLKALLAWRPSTASMTTAGSALALVVGLLCLSAWVVKRSLPRSARVLPTDVAEVLGRVPLAGRQVGQLVRVGRKLLLVATTPHGIETLTEITDEEDVQNLLRICDEAHGRGAQAAFDEVFRQMTREPNRPGFLGGEALDYDPRQLAAAYARTPGGRASA
jgi:flagellar biogenesis protein FliO